MVLVVWRKIAMYKSIILADFHYIKSELEELEKELAETHDELDPAMILLDDIIRHVDAFIEEDV